jgi:hypothetical protein
VLNESLPTLKAHCMTLYRVDMSIDVLQETSIGKVIKRLHDFCQLYQDEFTELAKVQNQCNLIMEKWKNLVLTMVFEDKKNFVEEFSKFKYKQKCELKRKRQKPKTKIVSSVQRQGSEKNSILCIAIEKYEQ